MPALGYKYPEYKKLLSPDDPTLKNKSDKVESQIEADEIIYEMEKSLTYCQEVRLSPVLGLAAPQIGIFKRVIFFRISITHPFEVMVNPVVKRLGNYRMTERETCLSCKGSFGVSRPTKAEIEYQQNNMEKKRVLLTGKKARVVLHEIDHLEGILINESNEER